MAWLPGADDGDRVPAFAEEANMTGSWLVEMCRRSCRRKLMAWFGVAAFVGLLWFANARYVSNFVSGPYAVGESDLVAITMPESAPHYYVTVDASEMLETGLQQISVETRNGREVSRRVSAEYYAAVVGERLLVVKALRKPPLHLEGTLRRLPPDVVAHLVPDGDQDVLRAILPAYMEMGDFREPGYWSIAGTSVFLVVALLFGVPAWRQLRSPEGHPVIRRVDTWGPISWTAPRIEQEVNHPAYTLGATTITQNFVVRRQFFRFDVSRIDDLLWAYKKVTKHSVNFIPTGKSYAAELVFADRRETIPGSADGVDGLLGHLAARAPWVVFGYDKDLEREVKRDPQGFKAAVDERRRAWQTGQAESA